jgi:ComF family protein
MRGSGADLIHAFKYGGAPSLAGFIAARMAAAWMPGSGPVPDYLVPVPLHKNRERERGYNQSRLLAEQLTARCGVLTAPGLLVRTRATAAQATLRPELRAPNVSGAFATSLAEAVRGKNILLIDDVATTGSTLRECTEVLRRSGCAHVSALVGALS